MDVPGADGSALFLCAGLHGGSHSSTPLYKLLPEIIVIRKHQIEREPLLQGTIHGLLREVANFQEGRSFALLRGLELIYLLGLRVALDVESATTPMRRALRDPRIANALLYMHTKYKERSDGRAHRVLRRHVEVGLQPRVPSGDRMRTGSVSLERCACRTRKRS